MALVLGLVLELVYDHIDVVVNLQTDQVHHSGQPYAQVHHTIPKIDL